MKPDLLIRPRRETDKSWEKKAQDLRTMDIWEIRREATPGMLGTMENQPFPKQEL